MEIKIGEYIRTVHGTITKIVEIREEAYICEKSLHVLKSKVTKHSENILDLIEVDDFVNKHKILKITKENDTVYLHTKYAPMEFIDCTKTKIETILTHEQYDQNCFKMGD